MPPKLSLLMSKEDFGKYEMSLKTTKKLAQIFQESFTLTIKVYDQKR